jgi:hypothetical protein
MAQTQLERVLHRFQVRVCDLLDPLQTMADGVWVHIGSAVRSPTTTGKIERFHKTLRTEFLAHHVFATIEDAQAGVDGWLEQYNTVRPHQALGMCTPAQRFRAGDKTVVPTVATGWAGKGASSINRGQGVKRLPKPLNTSSTMQNEGRRRRRRFSRIGRAAAFASGWRGCVRVRLACRTG